jgi:uncharacterized membrane protein
MSLITDSLLGGLHLTATAFLVGYFLLLAVVFQPAFEKTLDEAASLQLLGVVHKRWQPVLILSVLVFIVTGAFLLVGNEAYQGLGKFFDNSWSIVMTIKHVAVTLMIVLSFTFNAFFRKSVQLSVEPQRVLAEIRGRIRLTAVIGVCVLLLTAVCQAL